LWCCAAYGWVPGAKWALNLGADPLAEAGKGSANGNKEESKKRIGGRAIKIDRNKKKCFERKRGMRGEEMSIFLNLLLDIAAQYNRTDILALFSTHLCKVM
jgi:hypothetical protein